MSLAPDSQLVPEPEKAHGPKASTSEVGGHSPKNCDRMRIGQFEVRQLTAYRGSRLLTGELR